MPLYVAWTMADLVSNASGLGFNGYDENGQLKWDLLTNINVRSIEVLFFYFLKIQKINS
jgi:hypothetical protein